MALDETTRSVVVETKNSNEPPPDEGADLTVLDLFKRIYQFFYSKTVGLIIILAMAVCVLIGVLLPQATAAIYDDPEAKAQFLAQQSERLGGLANVADFLGFFRMFSSPLFLVVTALLALSIAACTAHRIPQLWQRFRHPRVHVTPRFFELARYRGSFELDQAAGGSSERETASDVAASAMTGVRAYLTKRHYRVIDDEPGRSMYADRFAWGGFGTVVAHASFIIILAAFVISASGGIDQNLAVPVGGDPVDVGHGTGMSVQATSFNATTYDDGRPKDYVAHLIVTKGGAQAGEQDVRVNEPLRAGAVKFHQNSYGIGAEVEVKDAGGKVIADRLVPLSAVESDSVHVYGGLDLPDGTGKIQVVTPASGATSSDLAAGEAALQLFTGDSAQPATMTTAQQGESATLGDLTVTFKREAQYTLINVRQDPGTIWFWIGSALLVLGMSVTFACRHRRIWVRVTDDDDGRHLRFASNDKEDLAFERHFTALVYDMSAALEQRPRAKETQS